MIIRLAFDVQNPIAYLILLTVLNFVFAIAMATLLTLIKLAYNCKTVNLAGIKYCNRETIYLITTAFKNNFFVIFKKAFCLFPVLAFVNTLLYLSLVFRERKVRRILNKTVKFKFK